MAEKSCVGIVLDEAAIPVGEAVRAAAELTGIDPLHVANEGKLVAGVRPARGSYVGGGVRPRENGGRGSPSADRTDRSPDSRCRPMSAIRTQDRSLREEFARTA